MYFTQQYVTVSVFQLRVKVLGEMIMHGLVAAKTGTANVIKIVRGLKTAVQIFLNIVIRMETQTIEE